MGAASEIVKWLNHVAVLTLAADLSESINLEHGLVGQSASLDHGGWPPMR